MIDFKRPIFSTKMRRYIKDYYAKNKLFAIFASGASDMFIDANFIKPCADGSIGYLPLGKFAKYATQISTGEVDPFDDGIGRIKCKPGKFINKYLNPSLITQFDIKPKDVEQFSLLLRSNDEFYYSQIKMVMVDGEDLRKYYGERSYAYRGSQKGTLWKSCMRYNKTLPLLDLYVRNPHKVKMLVGLLDGMVAFRALIWKTDEGFGFVDRLYYTKDSDVEFVRQWASKGDLYQRYHHSANNEDIILSPSGEVVSKNLTVTIDNLCGYYPFLDTFKFHNLKNKSFSNIIDKPHKTEFVVNRANGGVRTVEEYLNPPVREDDNHNNNEDWDDDWNYDEEFVDYDN